jgi:hypothetical protein
MKTSDVILLSLSLVFFVIGVHQTYLLNELAASYYLFMLSLIFWMIYRVRFKLREVQSKKNNSDKK